MNHHAPPSTSTVRGEARACTEAVRRLDREFRGDVHRSVIRTVVRGSLAELDCPSLGALPELVERLARERLRERLRRS